MSLRKIRVMLVDDSAIIRGLIDRALKADPAIEVVSTAANGEMAINMITRIPADVIVLDIEMPVMDGIEALPRLLEVAPAAKVIMASTLTTRNAEISLKAMQLGAADYVPKPSSTKDMGQVNEFYRELIEKIHALAPKGFVEPEPGSVPVVSAGSPEVKRAQAVALPPPVTPPTTAVKQSELPPTNTQVLGIASSTGGPQALLEVFRSFKGVTPRVPIFITQHMPPNFTTILADHLSKACGLVCAEAKDGEPVVAGRVYVAPGDYHMVVEATGTQRVVRLNQNPPENFCRPSADPMFRSLSAIYKDRLLICVLTGLGSDGARGAAHAVAHGATVVAQDEASSVVYGMPKAVAEAKLTSAIFPLPRIAPYLIKAVG